MGHVPVLAPHFNENVYFNENPTQRDVPIVNPWPGAIPIQDQLERINWLGMGAVDASLVTCDLLL